MAEKSIADGLRQFIAQNFILDDGIALDDDASLVEQGIIDSTGILELVMFVEETFNFKIADQELTPANLDSIRKLEAYIRSKQGRPGTVATLEPSLPQAT